MNIENFEQLPILGILRGISKKHLNTLIETIIESGLKTIEITLNTENALELIKTAKKISKGNLSIGAGTVLTEKAANDAIKSGAEFIVTPGLIDKVTKYCNHNKIPFFPGALTPTEVYNAWNEGATMVKVFPASIFGPEYFKELKGPFNNIELMAVGGITSKNCSDYFKNGADAAAFGSSIFKLERLEKKQFQQIKKDIIDFISSAKNT